MMIEHVLLALAWIVGGGIISDRMREAGVQTHLRLLILPLWPIVVLILFVVYSIMKEKKADLTISTKPIDELMKQALDLAIEHKLPCDQSTQANFRRSLERALADPKVTKVDVVFQDGEIRLTEHLRALEGQQ